MNSSLGNEGASVGEVVEGPENRLRKLTLKANFLWMFSTKLFGTGVRWVMFLALAKLGDAGAVGLWTLGQAICVPIMLLTSLNLRATMMTDARNEYTYGHYIGLRVGMGGLLILIAFT